MTNKFDTFHTGSAFEGVGPNCCSL